MRKQLKPARILVELAPKVAKEPTFRVSGESIGTITATSLIMGLVVLSRYESSAFSALKYLSCLPINLKFFWCAERKEELSRTSTSRLSETKLLRNKNALGIFAPRLE